jgi:hypothetical protein
MDRGDHQNPAAIIGGLSKAAILLNRCDLRSKVLTEAREFNAAEQAVRDGIALIEASRNPIRTRPLAWTTEQVGGMTVHVGRGLGLKYQVAEKVDKSGWTWVFGVDGGYEPTEEAARSVCEREFSDRLRLFILTDAAI